MRDNDVDQFFCDRLGSHDSAVPDDMWQRISGEKGNGRIIPMWILYTAGAVALVTLLLGAQFITNPAQHIAVPAATQTSVPPAITSVAPGPVSPAAPKAVPRTIPLTALKAKTTQAPIPENTFSAPHSALTLSITQLSKRSPVEAYIKQPPTLRCPASTYREATVKWTADAFASPLYLANTVRYKPSYSLGARLTMIFKKHYTVTTGLQYAHIDLNNHQNSLPDHINNVDIPVLVGYTNGNKKYTVGVNAGLIFNVYSHTANPIYQPGRRAAAATVGLDFAKNLNDQYALFAAPYARYELSNNGELLQDKTVAYGLLLGLRYRFRKL